MMNRTIFSTPCILWIMLFVTIQGQNTKQLSSIIKTPAYASSTSSSTNQSKQASIPSATRHPFTTHSGILTSKMVTHVNPSTHFKRTGTPATKQTNVPIPTTNQHIGRTKSTKTIGHKTTSSSIHTTVVTRTHVRSSSPKTATERTTNSTLPLQKNSTGSGITHGAVSPTPRRTNMKPSLTSTPNYNITTTRTLPHLTTKPHPKNGTSAMTTSQQPRTSSTKNSATSAPHSTAKTINITTPSVKATTHTVPQNSSNPTATTLHTKSPSVKATTHTVPQKPSNPSTETLHTESTSFKTTMQSTTVRAKLSTKTIANITHISTDTTHTVARTSISLSHSTAAVTASHPKYTTVKASEKTANTLKPAVQSRTTVVQTTILTTNRINTTTESSGAFTTQHVDTTRVLSGESTALLKKKDIKYVILGASFAAAVVAFTVVAVVVRRQSALKKRRVVLDDKDVETMAANSSIKEAETLVLSATIANDRDSTIKNPVFTESEQKLYAVG